MSFSLESCNQNKVPKNPKSTRDTKRFLKSSLNISLASLKLLPFFFFCFFPPKASPQKPKQQQKKTKLVLIAPEGISSRSPLSALSSVSLFFFFLSYNLHGSEPHQLGCGVASSTSGAARWKRRSICAVQLICDLISKQARG